ncbi:MAG: hypothetical protein ABWZ82_10965 [Candidatus Limnocylindrales bacterium]
MDLTRYLVELHRPGGDRDGLPASIEAARTRARGMAAKGDPVRVLRSVYVPEDDAWFLLVEAPSTGHVERLFQPQRGSIGTIAPAVVPVHREDEP